MADSFRTPLFPIPSPFVSPSLGKGVKPHPKRGVQDRLWRFQSSRPPDHPGIPPQQELLRNTRRSPIFRRRGSALDDLNRPDQDPARQVLNFKTVLLGRLDRISRLRRLFGGIQINRPARPHRQPADLNRLDPAQDQLGPRLLDAEGDVIRKIGCRVIQSMASPFRRDAESSQRSALVAILHSPHNETHSLMLVHGSGVRDAQSVPSTALRQSGTASRERLGASRRFCGRDPVRRTGG